jgi:hypothetical protein
MVMEVDGFYKLAVAQVTDIVVIIYGLVCLRHMVLLLVSKQHFTVLVDFGTMLAQVANVLWCGSARVNWMAFVKTDQIFRLFNVITARIMGPQVRKQISLLSKGFLTVVHGANKWTFACLNRIEILFLPYVKSNMNFQSSGSRVALITALEFADKRLLTSVGVFVSL